MSPEVADPFFLGPAKAGFYKLGDLNKRTDEGEPMISLLDVVDANEMMICEALTKRNMAARADEKNKIAMMMKQR